MDQEAGGGAIGPVADGVVELQHLDDPNGAPGASTKPAGGAISQ